MNAGGIRSSVEAGDVTLEMVKTVLPMSDRLCVLRITGTELLETLEAACQDIGYGNDVGSFPQVSGIEFTIDATVPYEKGENYPDSTFAPPKTPGTRVTIHTVGGRDFDEDAAYSLVGNDYLTQGGGTYYPVKLAAEREAPIMGDFNYEAFTSYLIGPLGHVVDERCREPQGRITIITE